MAAPLDRLRSGLGRDLFLPLGFRLSLALEQVTWAEVTEDASLAAFTIRSGQRLLGADGMINWFDTWLEAEGAGVDLARGERGEVTRFGSPVESIPDPATVVGSEAVQRVLEVARRLAAETGERSALLGFLTGGTTLLSHLFGDEAAGTLLNSFAAGRPSKAEAELLEFAAQTSIKIADAYCSAGVSALVLAEEVSVANAAYLKPFEPLFNLASYYNVPVILVAREGLDAAVADRIRQAGVAHVVPASDDRVAGVPLDALADEARARAWAAKASGVPGTRTFISEWDLPSSIRAEAVKALSDAIKEKPA